jgi:hypothetical protein
VPKLSALVLVSTALAIGPTAAPTAETPPRVFLLDASNLQAAKQRLREGHDEKFTAALAELKRAADAELKKGPYSVVDKPFSPPSGDKHDYMSQAPYFWADPNKPDGLPYIRRDGERNPEAKKYRNRPDLGNLMDAVDTLALAYYFTDDETYAKKAAELLRAWFLDPATRMNPNLKFGQFIPGENTGRGRGLIETAGLTRLIDDIGLLENSQSLTADDRRGLREWFDQFLTWMLESEIGRDEAAAKNNHGTYYDLQVVSFAFFLGKDDIAKRVLNDVGPKRVAQIATDGRQPLELARTKAWGYSLMNLNGLMSLARMGEHVGIDLWSYETPDGRSIKKAIDYMLPYAAGEKQWDHPQLGGWSPRGFNGILRRAVAHYPDERYREILAKNADETSRGYNALLRQSTGRVVQPAADDTSNGADTKMKVPAGGTDQSREK